MSEAKSKKKENQGGLDRENMKQVEESPNKRYYRYDHKLGSGAYKDVFMAYDVETGQEVAWNTVHLKGMPREEKQRIRAETEILSDLNHQGIINFFAVWDNPIKEQICFTTEIVTSGTLKQYTMKMKRIRLTAIKRWCTQILKALAYLHGHNPPIIHRDLKCDNIFINGSTSEIRIGDFGLAAAKDVDVRRSVLGTPEFMAPELYDEDYDESVDIYAFGMCVIEMVTKEYPYSECRNAAQVWKRVTKGLKPLVLDRILDTEIREFIELCLLPPCSRPTATELLEHPFLVFRNVAGRDNQHVRVQAPPKEPQVLVDIHKRHKRRRQVVASKAPELATIPDTPTSSEISVVPVSNTASESSRTSISHSLSGIQQAAGTRSSPGIVSNSCADNSSWHASVPVSSSNSISGSGVITSPTSPSLLPPSSSTTPSHAATTKTTTRVKIHSRQGDDVGLIIYFITTNNAGETTRKGVRVNINLQREDANTIAREFVSQGKFRKPERMVKVITEKINAALRSDSKSNTSGISASATLSQGNSTPPAMGHLTSPIQVQQPQAQNPIQHPQHPITLSTPAVSQASNMGGLPIQPNLSNHPVSSSNSSMLPSHHPAQHPGGPPAPLHRGGSLPQIFPPKQTNEFHDRHHSVGAVEHIPNTHPHHSQSHQQVLTLAVQGYDFSASLRQRTKFANQVEESRRQLNELDVQQHQDDREAQLDDIEVANLHKKLAELEQRKSDRANRKHERDKEYVLVRQALSVRIQRQQEHESEHSWLLEQHQQQQAQLQARSQTSYSSSNAQVHSQGNSNRAQIQAPAQVIPTSSASVPPNSNIPNSYGQGSQFQYQQNGQHSQQSQPNTLQQSQQQSQLQQQHPQSQLHPHQHQQQLQQQSQQQIMQPSHPSQIAHSHPSQSSRQQAYRARHQHGPGPGQLQPTSQSASAILSQAQAPTSNQHHHRHHRGSLQPQMMSHSSHSMQPPLNSSNVSVPRVAKQSSHQGRGLPQRSYSTIVHSSSLRSPVSERDLKQVQARSDMKQSMKPRMEPFSNSSTSGPFNNATLPVFVVKEEIVRENSDHQIPNIQLRIARSNPPPQSAPETHHNFKAVAPNLAIRGLHTGVATGMNTGAPKSPTLREVPSPSSPTPMTLVTNLPVANPSPSGTEDSDVVHSPPLSPSTTNDTTSA